MLKNRDGERVKAPRALALSLAKWEIVGHIESIRTVPARIANLFT